MVVDKQLRTHYSNLELAKEALDPETSRERALEALGNMDLTEVPLPTLPGENVTNPKAVADKQAKAILEQKLSLEQLEGRTDAEIAKQNEALNKFFQESAMLAYQGLCESAASNPELLSALKTEPLKWLDSINKNLWDTYKRDDSKRYEAMKLIFYRKEIEKQRWKDMLKDLALLWLKNSVEGAGKGVKDFTDQFFKMIKQALG
jgi:hypothetical protein